MRVTLIAHAYPPAPSSGARRGAHIARALASAGFDVRVITARSGGRGRHDEGEVEVAGVSPWPSGAGLLSVAGRLARARAGRSAATHAGEGVEPPDPLDPGPALRRWIAATLRFPDGRLGFLPPAVRAVLDPAHPPPNVVYTTGPPVTAHLTGLALHALGGPPWIAEYRDPWLVDGSPYRPPALRCAWTDRCERWLASRCLAAAAEVIVVSKGIAGEVAPRRAELGRPAPRVVLNGIPDLAPLGEPTRSGPRRIVHLGNLYAFRDPRPFFEGLAALLVERSWGPDDLEVEMLGEPPAAPFRRFASSLDLDDVVRFTGWVDHETGQDRLRRADVLLLLAQGQPLQIPNKLYEYLGSRRPILAFADAEGETARMLRRAGGGVILTGAEAPSRIAAELSELLDRGREVAAEADLGELERWKTERQMRRLVGIVHEVASRASTGRT